VVAVHLAVGQEAPGLARRDPAVARGHRDLGQAGVEPAGDVALGVEELDVGRGATRARRRRRQPLREPVGRAGDHLALTRHPHDEPALAVERLVDLIAQLAAHREVADHRREHDGDPDDAGGEQRQARPQAHQPSRST
jgi:hypothetical protein